MRSVCPTRHRGRDGGLGIPARGWGLYGFGESVAETAASHHDTTGPFILCAWSKILLFGIGFEVEFWEGEIEYFCHLDSSRGVCALGTCCWWRCGSAVRMGGTPIVGGVEVSQPALVGAVESLGRLVDDGAIADGSRGRRGRLDRAVGSYSASAGDESAFALRSLGCLFVRG